ncbi:hypothetical protein MBSD_n2143 [Mizugakiibacter sediminis]|uniref:Phage tail protein n=1 Tax=Mizugakiibacter sediminis TaxID=1475481 RepID=A0A0K8QPK6_9GAMM|nr:phage tail protein [Mizugakiibacter sediminis]GAP66828.1 hypothetical protein MBSD_n2143 [Mizugakiibacter sediminis]
MSVKLPNGTTFAIASGYGSPITVTALSNATEAVATATNTFATGDYVEITSGWSRLNGKIARVKSATASDFVLEGIDTSDTTIYPAGTGTGTVRKINGWTQIQQVLTTSTSGGDQQFATYQFIEADQETRIPTTKSAAGLDLSIADDPTLPGYVALSAANDDRNQRALKCTLSNGSIILYNAYCSLNKTPSMTANQVMACQATLSFLNADPVRYAS